MIGLPDGPRRDRSKLRRNRWLTAGIALFLPAAGLPLIADVPARATTVSCVAETTSAVQAAAVAKACDHPVVITESRSEYSRVLAQPDGRLTMESGVVPQWTRRVDGRWSEIDLGLARGKDGRLRPAASVADVAFSGGGDAPLVTLVRSGKTFTMSWQGQLPAPVVDGNMATYREVVPGVDLAVQATRTGFTHVLVVKTAAAAADPAVQRIRFDLGGDATAVRLPDGSLQARLAGTMFANAAPAVMWNSADDTGGLTAGRAGESPSESGSTVDGPGVAAQTARVETALTDGGELVLTPDAQMLADDSANFPIFIDPAWSVRQNRWAYATDNGCSNSDVSVARVGLSPEGPCQGQIYRSFFQFPTSSGGISLAGKHIESAYVQMKLDHSWSCDDTWAYMYHVPVIDRTMRATWSKMALGTLLDGAAGHANEAGGCGTIQPDMIMNFISSKVTQKVQEVADKKAPTLTVGFSARSGDGGESTQNRWKKFFPNDAKLVVDYDSKPGKPTGLQVAGVACLAADVLPIGTLNPTFSAIYPDADSSQSLMGTYEWIEVPAGGMGAVTDTYPTRLPRPPTASAPANGRATTAAVAAAKNKSYAFRATAVDPAPYSIWSGWSSWCQFRVDTTVPSVEATVISGPSGPGEPVTFRIASPDTDVVSFRYGWTGPTTVVDVPGTPKSTTLTLRPPKYGRNTLYVSAVDATRNEGYASAEFIVGRPSAAIARWGLETYPGVSQQQALADQQGALAGDTPLTATNVTWTPDVRMVGGASARFNGINSHAITDVPVLDTSHSFSVAAWVKPAALPTTDMKVLTQDARNAARFEFGVRRQDASMTPYWSFVMKDTSDQASASRVAMAPTPITAADVHRWTHLAGVYDRTDGKLRLYVNGVKAGEVPYAAAPWAAEGRFAVGRGFANGQPANWWHGELADVRVFNRVLVEHDFTGLLATDEDSGGFDEPGILAPIEVGRWDMNAATPCYEVGIPHTCQAPDGAAWGRRLSLAQGASIGSGLRDGGLLLDGTHFVEDPTDRYYGSPTVEHGHSQHNTVTPELPTWQDGPVLRTNDSFTVSVWVHPDSLRSSTQTAVGQRGLKQSAFYLSLRETRTSTGSSTHRWQFTISGADDDRQALRVHAEGTHLLSADDTDTWTHLVGVYDAQTAEIRLYLNGSLEKATPCPNGVFPATGPLTVGAAQFSGPGEQPRMMDFWHGGIDDLQLYQGALTDAAVAELHRTQSRA
ncbi:LamG domain-containing protein [Micromonospora sp. NPDC048871]|uniref:LamG domain-containing protein n=1 Tax=unclassified Micromonospora TaxID=2617518 RepID=UPI002E14F657|nr:LamG domain-containing protein [Micromonospora sp. NBC_01739]